MRIAIAIVAVIVAWLVVFCVAVGIWGLEPNALAIGYVTGLLSMFLFVLATEKD